MGIFVSKSSRNKLMRMSLEELAKSEHFHLVRSRIRAVRLFRHYLKGHHDQFGGFPTFESLNRSIVEVDVLLDKCELILRRYAVGEIDVREMDELILDDVTSALDDLSSPFYSVTVAEDQASQDAEELMARVWNDVISQVQPLEDLLTSVWDSEAFPALSWRRRFDEQEAVHLADIT